MDQFRQGVRQAPGSNIMDGNDRVLWAQGNTTIDHLLTAPLHFGVAPLYRGKIECLVAFARINTGSGSTSKANQHRRPT